MSSEQYNNTPEEQDGTQPMESPSEQSESVWGRLIPVCSNHSEITLNQVFEFRDSIITLGRDTANDICLKCPNISSKHCRILRNISPISPSHIADTIFLEDTSTNGTWVDKKKISKKKILINDGSEIILVPASKKRKRKKLSYFFHLENKNKKLKILAQSAGSDSLESKYYIIRDLGKGAFSTVKLVQDRNNGKKYALKCIDRNAWQRMKHATKRDVTLLDEVEIMKKANHPNIVKVYEYFEETKMVNVILDFCGGGDMLEYIQDNGPYSSSKGRLIFKQLIDSVHYLHSLKIAHRDLKPDNILLTDKNGDQLKLSDFGISREQSSSGCGTIIGTPLYQAPEVHLRRGQFKNGYDGTLADYWSLGVILYVMLVAAPPISTSESSTQIIEMSEKKTLPWYDEPIPETAKDLIYKLLQTDPNKRITAKNIYKHPWMEGYDHWNDIPSKHNHNGDDEEEEIKENNNNNKNNLIELDKSGTTDSKQEEEEEETQNGEEYKDILQALSSSGSADTNNNNNNNNNNNDIDIDMDVTMESISITTPTPPSSRSISTNGTNDSISASLSTSISTSTSSSSSSSSSLSTSMSSNSSMSRKRKANFNDDNDSEIKKPPTKKQKSDPNGIQNADLIPVNLS